MNRPRTALIAIAALALGAGAGQLGSAEADSSTGATGTTGVTSTAAPDTIVVNGSDTITIPTGSPTSTADSTYQSALGGALTDAGQKATFIASQVGATLGPITNVTETSDSSDLCQSAILFAPGTAKATTTPSKHKTHHGPLIRAVTADSSDSCSVEADVTVTYTMTPS